MNGLDLLFDNGIEAIGRFYSYYQGNVLEVDKYPLLKIEVVSLGYTLSTVSLLGWRGNGWGIKGITPQVGDSVWVIFLNGDVANPYWLPDGTWRKPQELPLELMPEEVFGVVTPRGNSLYMDDKTGDIHINTQGTVYVDSESNIIFNQGKKGGLINILDLTNKLNNLVQEVNQLRSLFNIHTHYGVQPGSGSTGNPSSSMNKSITRFDSSDYEDTKVKH